jgi:NAD+ kinase
VTSTAGSTKPSARAVTRAAVVTHGHPERVAEAFERLRALAAAENVELLLEEPEARKHGLEATREDVTGVDLAVVLGGDGTMLRALARFLGTGVPVLGVNFGRVGFLSAIPREQMEEGLTRAFRGGYRTVALPTLEVVVAGERWVAVNDLVVTSAQLGRMVELEWAIEREDLGRVACDGIICSTPSGSTAYNLSNGGPVLVWGLEAMAITFIAPHSLDARPIVVGPGQSLVVENRTPDVTAAVLVDGHRAADLASGASVGTRLATERSLLAVMPDQTFFRRYRETFAS